jgi:deoxyadenosine/deoxycytidine kinase
MFSKTYNVDRHIYNFLRGSIIIIEGQIGVGKTTLGSSMKARLDELNIPCTFYPETVHAPWLEMFLSDIPKYALGYEMFCTTSRLLTYEKAIRKRDQGHVCIIDRSLDGDMVFAKSLLNRQDMTPEEFEVTRSWSTKASNTEIEPPDYLIYLQTSTQVAINRTAKRDRKGEDKYDIGYFSELNHEYELMMNNISSKRHKLYVDWSNDLELNDDNLLDGKYIDSLVRQIRDP